MEEDRISRRANRVIMFFLNIPNLFTEDEWSELLDMYWPQVFILNNDHNVVFASPDRETLVTLIEAINKTESYNDTPVIVEMIREGL